MARVVVILALLLLITGAIFGLTRNASGPRSAIDADARTTLSLAPGEKKGTSGTSGAPVASAQELVTGLVAGAAPAFSSVGVDHKGRASFTGTASPGDRIAIVRDEKVLGKSAAGRDGSWTIEFRVPPVREAFELRVESRRKDGLTVEGPQRAMVSPPETSGGLPRVTLAGLELPKAQAPAEEETPSVAGDASESTEPEVGIVIEKVVSDGKGAASLKGRADAGWTIKVQLEGNEAGSVNVGKDGAWSLQVSNPTDRLIKSARVVLMSAAGKEMDFSEIPLSLPPLAKSLPTGSAVASGAAVSVAAVAGTPRAVSATGSKSGHGYYVKVRRGDSLWKLAKRHYGDGRKWTRILKANRKRVGDPDLIRPGRRLYLP